MRSKGSEDLRRVRTERGLTQHEAGKLVDQPAQAISAYERGAYAPSRSSAGKIEAEFGIPVGAWDEAASERPAA